MAASCSVQPVPRVHLPNSGSSDQLSCLARQPRLMDRRDWVTIAIDAVHGKMPHRRAFRPVADLSFPAAKLFAPQPSFRERGDLSARRQLSC